MSPPRPALSALWAAFPWWTALPRLRALLVPTAESVVLSRTAPVEIFAQHLRRATILGSASATLQACTIAAVGLLIGLRTAER